MPVRVPDSGGTSSGDTFTSSGSTGLVGPGGAGAGAGASGSGGGGTLVTPGSVQTKRITTTVVGVFRETADRVARGPGMELDPNATVNVRPIASSGAANTQNVFVATGPGDAARVGPRITLTPTQNPITLRVRNLNDIQVYGSVAGEGVELDVQL